MNSKIFIEIYPQKV